MKRLLMVIEKYKDNETKDAAAKCAKKIISKISAEDAQIRIISTGPLLEQPITVIHQSEWISLDEAHRLLDLNLGNEERISSPMGKSSDLAIMLHEAADTLPYLGYSLDLIFIMGCLDNCNLTTSTSFIPIAGALKRLIEWHNGHAVFVKLKPELSAIGKQLAEFGHCQIVDSCEELVLKDIRWTGKISMNEPVENTTHVFSGYFLHCDDWDTFFLHKLPPIKMENNKRSRNTKKHGELSQPELKQPLLGRTIEVLQEVDLRTFPLFLVDSWTLQLGVRDDSSKDLFDYIQNMEQTGLLVRLRVYPDGNNILTCGELFNMNTRAWKERIIANYQDVSEPEEIPLAHGVKFIYFLLLPNHEPSTSIPTYVLAKSVLSPHEVNRNLHTILEDHMKIGTSNSTLSQLNPNSSFLSDTPVMEQREKLTTMLNLLQRSQELLKDTEELAIAERTQVLETVAKVQDNILTAAFSNCRTLKDYMTDNTRPKSTQYIHWIPESHLDSSKFPEKLTLQAKDSTRKSLHSYPSMDSVVSSPLSLADLEKKKNSTDFDINDVLQIFKPDGSHITLPKTPVKLKGRGLCRVESQQDINVNWPDSQQIRYHDIYYYTDENDLHLEKIHTKIRDQGNFQDTCCSFLSPIKKRQKPRLSPVRSSPRRATVMQRLMSREKFNNLNGKSHQSSSSDNSFKKPSSGRLSSPLKTSTQIIPTSCSSCETTSRKRKRSSNPIQIPPEPTRKSPRKRLSCLFTHEVISKAEPTSLKRENLNQNTPGSSKLDSSKSLKKNVFATSCELGKSDASVPVPWALTSLDPPVRRSPRKSTQSAAGTFPLNFSKLNNSSSSEIDLMKNFPTKETPKCNQESSSEKQKSEKLKRSERHKMKLKKIIENVLAEKNVKPCDTIYAACCRNLFNVSMVLLKTLTTSHNLTEEMKTVVHTQVTQIINLEKRRCGITV
ncbi:uncharacterized protein LOC131927769 [Physella acuta]|uniref:uncharacterized protein LOC131927769 n=1 Tax=Physella acuta TaxID=109671 RepID=UPI0027DBF809|nr:uncharacterized protein LOC131927769 [Physella acuta]